jgi:glyoxylase-like metal-dependent hydrolase (beta-lactamase superfamily II)
MILCRITLLLIACLTIGGAARAGLFAEPWHDGTKEDEPILQVQRVDRDTYILRQSIRTNFEGPFLFLFFGSQRALLLDSGAGGLRIRPTIEKLIADWGQESGKGRVPLIVAHTHGHGDHVAGDDEFKDLAGATVVGHAPGEVADFFKVARWPDQIAPFDLGGRILDIIPSPGHEAAEITVFDRQTKLLFTGDALYPGRLYCTADNFDAYRRSVDRVVAFTKDQSVAWLIGNHIEMTDQKRRDFAMHAQGHPHEHRLELPYDRLLMLQAALREMGPRPALTLTDDFIFYPVP